MIAADDRGDIGYWHPGLHPLRPQRWDERLPYPGRRARRVARPAAAREDPARDQPDAGLARELEQPAVGRLDERRRRGARARSPAPSTASASCSSSSPRSRGTRATRADRDRRDLGHDRAAVPVRQRAKLLRAARSDRRSAPGTATARRAAALGRQLRRRPTPPGPSTRASRSGRSSRTALEAILIGADGRRRAAEILAGGTGALARVRHHQRRGARRCGTLGARAYATAARARRRRRSPSASAPPTRRLARAAADVRGRRPRAPASSPDLPFFDRGTWNQSVMLGRR